MNNINGVDIEYQYDGAHDARPTNHTLHGLDGLNLSCLDWMRLSHVCRLMAARNRKPKQAFVRVSGWTADRTNMRLIVDVLQDDDGTASVRCRSHPTIYWLIPTNAMTASSTGG